MQYRAGYNNIVWYQINGNFGIMLYSTIIGGHMVPFYKVLVPTWIHARPAWPAWDQSKLVLPNFVANNIIHDVEPSSYVHNILLASAAFSAQMSHVTGSLILYNTIARLKLCEKSLKVGV